MGNYSEPAPGKTARFFYYSQAAGGWVHGGKSLAAAFGPAAFNYNEKIEVLACQRIDLTDAELMALPVFDERRVVKKPR